MPSNTDAMAILEVGDTDYVPIIGLNATAAEPDQAVSMSSADRPLPHRRATPSKRGKSTLPSAP